MAGQRARIGECGVGVGRRRGGPPPRWLAVGILAMLMLAVLVPSRAARAQAAAAPEPAGGHLVLQPREGEARLAPLLEIDVALRVTGMIARGTVVQRFANPSDEWLEATYVFPLPEGAAVDGLRMTIGERVIEGEIREREQARRVYEAARASGRQASLLEQKRSNAFTSKVANVAPGAEIAIEIDFQQTLAFDAAGFDLRLPWIAAPRFDPEGPAPHGAADPEPGDADPPTRGARPDVALAIDLDPGFPLAGIESPSHEIALEQLGLVRFLVTLGDDVVPADRDFVLRWRPSVDSEPRAAVFREQRDGEDYLLMMLLPPGADAPARHGPREIVFVIDTSGSMGGASIEQARAALRLALSRLEPADRFNVIAFDSETRMLFPEPVHADAPRLARALEWVAGLEAGGGTVMLPAIREALRDPHGGAELRQVVFVTDGCVGNEQELFAYVREHLGRSRLFTVGIGSAPNGHFMEGAARFGRGSRTFIAKPEEVREKMAALFEKLERPALTDLEIDWGPGVEAWPARLPDLYLGEPVLVTARLAAAPGSDVGALRIRGRLGSAPYEKRLAIAPGRVELGIEKLFAQRKIAALTDGLVTGEDADRVREQVVAVALEHGLVSRYTSLVAVERTPARPLGEGLASAGVNAGLPAGFLLPQSATPGPLLLAISFVLLALGLALLGLAPTRESR